MVSTILRAIGMSINEIRPALLPLPAQADTASTSRAKAPAAHPIQRSKDDLDAYARKHTLGNRITGLQQALQREAHRHWRYDRTVNQDGAQSLSYANRRREELAAIPGGASSAAQYGLTFARNVIPMDSFIRELELQHDVESDYLRDMPSPDYLAKCQDLYRQKQPNANMNAAFVNSRHSAEMILHHLREQMPGTDSHSYLQEHFSELRPGVYALQLDPALKEKAESLIHTYGARPSVYNVMSDGTALTPSTDRATDNRHWLALFRPADGESVASRLHRIPDSAGVAGLGHTAATLLDQLLGLLEDEGIQQAHRRNPLLANGLRALHGIADTLPSLSHDNMAFCNGYQAMMEELSVCLSAVKPYTLKDFRQAAAPLTAAQHLPLSVPKPEVHLVSSGMGALSLGFELAELMTGSANVEDAATRQHGKTPVYYEVDNLKKQRQAGSKHADTLYAALGHSLPETPGQPGWSVDSVIAAVDKRLGKNKSKHSLHGAFKSLKQHLGQAQKSSKPLVLVLDATLERRGDMDRLVGHFSKDIAAGKLRIVACKSYQKYPNLCSGKVMAGGITLISADDEMAAKGREHLKAVEKDLGWINNSEMQLMTHMLKGREHEFELLERSVDNGNFVAQQFFTGQQGHLALAQHSPHLPFATIETPRERSQFSLHLAEGVQTLRPDYRTHLNTHLLRWRDSFGFPSTTLALIPGSDNKQYLRFAFGQESKAELTERFYMPSRLLREDSKWSCAQAFHHIQELVNKGLRDAGIPSHSPLSMAQKLNAIAHAELLPIDDQHRLQSDEIDALRRQPRPDSNMTLNRIASVVMHLSSLITSTTDPQMWQKGPDRDLLDVLLGQLIQSGMPGVSRTGRASILELQAFLCRGDMQSNDVTQQLHGLSTLTSSCQRMPGALRGGEYLSAIPNETFEAAPKAVQEQVIAALFSPLDSQTRLALIQSMVDDFELSKATACLDHFDQQLSRASPLEAESLHSARQGRLTDRPEQISTHQRTDLSEQLLKQRLAIAEQRSKRTMF